MRHISLFSGMGGFDLASEWMGWDNIAHCEINEFCLKILKYYWPYAQTHTDIKKTDFSIYRGKCDIVTGGFPCQPFSSAGLRKGTEDDRHLWPEMLRAIREIRPTWIVGENVLGIINWNDGLVFEQVQADLEAEGYKVQPFVLPACAIGAPHRRDRVWFVCRLISNAGRDGCFGPEASKEIINSEQPGISLNGFTPFSGSGIITDTNKPGFQSTGKKNILPNQKIKTRSTFNGDSKARNWDGFPTQSPVCDGDDGLSSQLDGITFPDWRTESLRAGGNAIVPHLAYQIFKSIQAYNNLNHE